MYIVLWNLENIFHVYHFYVCITDGLKLLKASLHTDSEPKLSDIIRSIALLRTFCISGMDRIVSDYTLGNVWGNALS